jgi:hypothetical protein
VTRKQKLELLTKAFNALSTGPLANAVLYCQTLWMQIPLPYRRDFMLSHSWTTATGTEKTPVQLFTLQCLDLETFLLLSGGKHADDGQETGEASEEN